MTQLDRAKSILKKILALPEEAWTLERLGDVDTNVTLQSGWSALVTPKFIDWPPSEEELLAAGEAETENDFPYSFTVDLLVAGRGKVMSFDCGFEERLTAIRPGPWENDLFNIEELGPGETAGDDADRSGSNLEEPKCFQ